MSTQDPTEQSIEQILEQILSQAYYKGKDGEGYSEYEMNLDIAALTTLMQSVCEEVIGGDKTDNDETLNNLFYGTRNGLRKTQRANLAQLLNGKDIT